MSLIGLPSPKELGNERDWNKAVAKVKQDAGQFMAALQKALQASAEGVTWFAPGQLLVIGDAARHEQAARILAQLADPNAKPKAALATLHAKTSKRAAERKERVEKLGQSRRVLEVAEALDEFSWRLLAAACGGELDVEALTELQIAWKADETRKLLDGQGAGLALRSAWAVTTAARTLAGQTELAALAAAARTQVRPAADKAVAAIQTRPQDASAMVAAVYAALAVDQADLRASVLAALPRETPAGSPLAVALVVARGLLNEATAVDGGQLAKLATAGGVVGEDATVLLAMACRRAGGDAWAAFRGQMGELLGQQPLPGHVVVLVNRLSGAVPGLGRL